MTIKEMVSILTQIADRTSPDESVILVLGEKHYEVADVLEGGVQGYRCGIYAKIESDSSDPETQPLAEKAVFGGLNWDEGWCRKCVKEKTCTYWNEHSMKCRDFTPKAEHPDPENPQ